MSSSPSGVVAFARPSTSCSRPSRPSGGPSPPHDRSARRRGRLAARVVGRRPRRGAAVGARRDAVGGQWTPADDVAAWLGWLDLPQGDVRQGWRDREPAAAVRRDGYRRAAVLGMGGSSLARSSSGRLFDGETELRVCDSTHPDAVAAFAAGPRRAEDHSLRVVEVGDHDRNAGLPAALADSRPGARFRGHHRSRDAPGRAGPRPGVPRHRGWRAAVGGRYSALSVFGLVPAALRGVDVAEAPGRGEDDGGRLRPAPDNRASSSPPPSARLRSRAATSSRF